MKFAEALKEVVWCLLSEGPVSYRRIKQDFGLDDEALDELRLILIETKGWAADLNGRFLVWNREGEPTRVPTAEAVSRARLPRNSPIVADGLPADGSSGPAATSAQGAERRQLTVMFCDLVGSTGLSTRLDPEDLADVIRAYQEAATAIVRRYDGFVAKYMGDGILVYFGYPHTLERDAERAILTGLAIVDAMPALNGEIGVAHGIELAVRLGIATGLVMVGETVGEGAATEKAVVGETPNLAARLQALAAPNDVVVSAVTHGLTNKGFLFEDLGQQTLKGIGEPVAAWRVSGRVEAETESDAVPPSATARNLLIGRDEEIGLLRRAWQQTRKEERGQVVLISGEPGIGKSTLLRTLRSELDAKDLGRMTFRCSPYHADSALYPVIEHLKRAARWQAEDSAADRLEKIEQMLSQYSLPIAETLPLIAVLLSLPLPEGRYPALDLTPQQLKQQTQDALIAFTLEEAERRPLIAMWEDLQWADASTLELVGLLIEQVPTVPLLMVLTFRPEFTPPWPARSHQTPITLNRLDQPQIEVMAIQLAGGKPLPLSVLEHIVRKTDGVPLYVEELTKAVLASGNLRDEGGRYVLTGPLSGLAIPASLQEVLMARLDRLPTMREVAQLGAVLGREFAYDMLRAIAAVEETKLRDGLGLLVDAELLYQRGRPPRSTYIFKHALIQDAAYQSLLKRTRQQCHQQVAALLEREFPETVAAQPDLVAHHYTEAGRAEAAVGYWQKAAQKAAQRSANPEVIGHATRALDLLRTLPDSLERAAKELPLQRLLGAALMASRGYAAPETGAAFRRARELCRVLDSEDVFPVLSGVYLFELALSKHEMALEIGQEIAERAKSLGDTTSLIVGQIYTGLSHLLLGRPVEAWTNFEPALQHYELERPTGIAQRFSIDLQAAGYLYGAWALWLLGRPDQALRCGDQGMAELEISRHPYSVARGLYWAAVFHHMRGEWALTEDRAQRCVVASEEYGFAMPGAAGRVMHGAARAALGDPEGGIHEMRRGLADYDATGARFQRAYLLTLLAEALGSQGRVDEGLTVLDEADVLVEATGERFWEAEIHRMRGTLMLAGRGTGQAVSAASYGRAMDIAKSQQARSLELRAARDLAALWADGGERRRAYNLLRPVYESFTQGFDLPDLVNAKVLLDTLQ